MNLNLDQFQNMPLSVQNTVWSSWKYLKPKSLSLKLILHSAKFRPIFKLTTKFKISLEAVMENIFYANNIQNSWEIGKLK